MRWLAIATVLTATPLQIESRLQDCERAAGGMRYDLDQLVEKVHVTKIRAEEADEQLQTQIDELKSEIAELKASIAGIEARRSSRRGPLEEILKR